MYAIYGAPWIPSIYPSHVSIYTSTMDPMGNATYQKWSHPFLTPSFAVARFCLVYDIAITAKLLAQFGCRMVPHFFVQVIGALLEVLEVSQNRCSLNHPYDIWTILVLKAMDFWGTPIWRKPHTKSILYQCIHNEIQWGCARTCHQFRQLRHSLGLHTISIQHLLKGGLGSAAQESAMVAHCREHDLPTPTFCETLPGTLGMCLNDPNVGQVFQHHVFFLWQKENTGDSLPSVSTSWCFPLQRSQHLHRPQHLQKDMGRDVVPRSINGWFPCE